MKNLIYLSMLALVLTATTALSLIKPTINILPKVLGAKEKPSTDLSLLPTLHATTFPVLSAQGAIAVDLNSSTTLFEKSPDTPLLPASTTKIMTALVALEFYNLDDPIKAGSIKVEGQKMGLEKGEELTVQSLLNGLLIYSANDAAEVLASAFPGGRDAFIEKMNDYTKILHLKHTTFTNPTGLDDPRHLSTARDLIHISEFALRNPSFAEIVRTKEATITSTDGSIVHKVKNINELLGTVEGVEGVKTGWTENARENLVTYVVRGNKKILIAVLGSQDPSAKPKLIIGYLIITLGKKFTLIIFICPEDMAKSHPLKNDDWFVNCPELSGS
jgi:D-alanyl-D-alanine carboxypeptidase